MGVALSLREQNNWSINSPLHNKVSEEDRPIHAWYRFVLSFPPHLVRHYLDRFGVNAHHVVLDPFCGTGTTLVEAKKCNIAGYGIEANPMAVLASKVKTNWTVCPNELKIAAESIVSSLEPTAIPLNAGQVDSAICEQETLYGLLDLDAEVKKLILANSISPLPLHRSLLLKSKIDLARDDIRDHLRLGLAWTLVNAAGNVRFGPEVGVTKPKLDVDVNLEWLNQIRRMCSDLTELGDRANVSSNVHYADARIMPESLPKNSVDFVFTSPPYPNEKDYTRTTRLESVILGLIQSKDELRKLKQGLVRSNTRNVYVSDDDHLYVESIPEIQNLANQIEQRRLELGKTSGFERLYHRVTKLYFGGMAKHFRELSSVLKPGAVLGYVVGDQASYLRVMIRTGQLIAQIAEREGYEVISIDLFRTRYATATRENLREEVVVLRWPGG